MVTAGYDMFAINPKAVDRYRDRHRLAGGKSDAADAKVLAELVRTDRHLHRPVAADTESAEALKALTRAHKDLIWRRQADQPSTVGAAGVLPGRAGDLWCRIGSPGRPGSAGAGLARLSRDANCLRRTSLMDCAGQPQTLATSCACSTHASNSISSVT